MVASCFIWSISYSPYKGLQGLAWCLSFYLWLHLLLLSLVHSMLAALASCYSSHTPDPQTHLPQDLCALPLPGKLFSVSVGLLDVFTSFLQIFANWALNLPACLVATPCNYHSGALSLMFPLCSVAFSISWCPDCVLIWVLLVYPRMEVAWE